MFVEKNRCGGKNSVDQFKRGASQNNQDRLDAMAITPLCMRVAYSMDNLLSYVPLWPDDPEYILEKQPQEEKFGECLCSCCNPAAAKRLLGNLVFANTNNFDQIVKDKFHTTEIRDLASKYPAKRVSLRKRNVPDAERPILDSFKSQLTDDLHDHYEHTFGSGGRYNASEIFGEEEAQAIVLYLPQINTTHNLRCVIGGKCFDGQLQWLFEKISNFKAHLSSTTRPGAHKKARVSSAPALMSTNNQLTRTRRPNEPDVIVSQAAPPSGSTPPSKTALVAQQARQQSLEKKEKKDVARIAHEKRLAQIALFTREVLEEAEKKNKTKQALTQPNPTYLKGLASNEKSQEARWATDY
ncbi:hypothetical protein MJO28_014073 [Puccinia striiformis f. sp. tritici]|uniref:Uncharacterized protein n=2 Tax=Puccinia striiformis TaxID=27350 RepID=A0A2S4V941_9BASI|nr:hypothetical protein MJO28_014073 [Puccinia striiformis f. sp. tritici]POW06017.1 hypothetical protein PSTT_09247 [Puccinia striiformis]